VLNPRPSLWVTYASALMMTGSHTAVEEKLQFAEAALQGIEPDYKTRDLVGRIASMRATVAVTQHDVEALLAQSLRALEYLDPDNLPLRTAANFTLGHAYQLRGEYAAAGRVYAEVISASKSFGPSIYTTAATLCLGQVQEADNQLHMAAETYRQAILLAGDPPRPIACEAHLGLARIYYQWNDLTAAERHGQQSVELTGQMDSVDTVAACGVLFARLRLARGDFLGASALLAEAEQFVRQHNFVHLMPDVIASQVLTLLRQGNVSEAAHLAEAHELPMSQARVHLAQGDPASALSVLAKLRLVRAKSGAGGQLDVMVLQVVALNAQGEKAKALQLLGEALTLAESGGFIRIFLDEGTPMCQLLSEVAAGGTKEHSSQPGGRPAHRRTVSTEKLLAAFQAENEQPKSEDKSYLPPAPLAALAAFATVATSPQPFFEPLSQRELEILQLITKGFSNQEISQRLFLALSTVKGHNRIIFSKLQVQRRTEAVARARELGLL